jgi:hypothetical protein
MPTVPRNRPKRYDFNLARVQALQLPGVTPDWLSRLFATETSCVPGWSFWDHDPDDPRFGATATLYIIVIERFTILCHAVPVQQELAVAA